MNTPTHSSSPAPSRWCGFVTISARRIANALRRVFFLRWPGATRNTVANSAQGVAKDGQTRSRVYSDTPPVYVIDDRNRMTRDEAQELCRG